MPKPTKGKRLGGSPAHQRLILANLARSLFEHEQIRTTEAKAKRLRPFAERLITKARRGDLHARRQVQAVIRDKAVVHKLFTEIGPSQAGRPGGYTRITKLGPRAGDNAPMAVIALVEPMTEPPASVTRPAEPAAPVESTDAVESVESAESAESVEVVEQATTETEPTEPAESGDSEQKS